MLSRAFYSAEIGDFLQTSADQIIGSLASRQSVDALQEGAWREQIVILKSALQKFSTGHVLFEMQIPRMGRRADVVLIIADLIFVLEFKVGANRYSAADLRQCHGYAIDLHHFHEGSHNKTIVPVLVATHALSSTVLSDVRDKVFSPLKVNSSTLAGALAAFVHASVAPEPINFQTWYHSSYKPTPTIVEAAQALYDGHRVEDIARNDAGAKNLLVTSEVVINIIDHACTTRKKVICFITGVPGAGKTLVGLNIATRAKTVDGPEVTTGVFLSGNGPLVDVLKEALARDSVKRRGSVTKVAALQEAGAKIQNIHWFRDEALHDISAPSEHVVIFDEAQRAWDKKHTVRFMAQKKGQKDFSQSEPEFLISVMDRHHDWCVIVALIGGGQEINNGEAGLQGWVSALANFPDWQIHFSEKLSGVEYAGGDVSFGALAHAYPNPGLHLSTSMRSFRAESLSDMIHHLIHNAPAKASAIYENIKKQFPVMVTRNLDDAKAWIRSKARANDTKGVIASSGGLRLKPEGLFVKNQIAQADWFLNDCDDVRSCHYLEDVATEFDIQGLELDWCLVAWDADYRYQNGAFEHWRFTGTSWKRRTREEHQRYLQNAYRVLLTRARQGMIIFVPEGDANDHTRRPEFLDHTFNYLLSCGVIGLSATRDDASFKDPRRPVAVA